MINYDELLGHVRQLTAEERLALIEATARMVKEDLRLTAELKAAALELPTNKDNGDKYIPFIRDEWLQLDEEALKAQGIKLRGTPVENVLGIARPNQNEATQTDEEIKEEYINYLIEKYS